MTAADLVPHQRPLTRTIFSPEKDYDETSRHLEEFPTFHPSAIESMPAAASNTEPLGLISMPTIKCASVDIEGHRIGTAFGSLDLAWQVHGHADLAYSPRGYPHSTFHHHFKNLHVPKDCGSQRCYDWELGGHRVEGVEL